MEAAAWEQERWQGGRKSGRSEAASETVGGGGEEERVGREEERWQRLTEGRKSGRASGERVRSGPIVRNFPRGFRKNVQGLGNPGRREYKKELV
jgi:hypothetical protein